MAYFPMFVDISDTPCLVVGGGMVAYRKVKVLLEFNAKIMIVTRDVCEEIENLAMLDKRISIELRDFDDADVQGKSLVVVATDDSEINSYVAKICKSASIPVNVVDEQELCTFIFPSYVKEKNVVAAFSSGGNSPALTQYLKAQERSILTPELGEINEFLGRWRPSIKELFPTEAERKNAFAQILDYALCKNAVPTDEEVEEVLSSIAMNI